MYCERFREMNCEKCQELLSEFLDGTLGHLEHAAVGAHLAACAACAAAREDFHAIIAVAREARGQLFAPADERALWLRVRNTVEAEGPAARASAPRAAALVVAVASVTALGVRYAAPDEAAPAGRGAAVRRVVSDEFYPRTYLET